MLMISVIRITKFEFCGAQNHVYYVEYYSLQYNTTCPYVILPQSTHEAVMLLFTEISAFLRNLA